MKASISPTCEFRLRNLKIIELSGFDIKTLIDISGGTAVVIECPGYKSHTSPSGEYDSVIFVDSPRPVAYCFHDSCRQKIKSLNKQLWIASANAQNPGLSPSFCKEQQSSPKVPENELKKRLALEALKWARAIPHDYAWTEYDAMDASPTRFETSDFPDNHLELHLQLFKGKGSGEIWLGKIYDSGKVQKRVNFKPLHGWVDEVINSNKKIPLYPHTSPCLFKPGSFSRCKDNVLSMPFLVIEHDKIAPTTQLAFYRFIRQEFGLRLRALIDTAGKSIHAWWDYPSKEMIEQLTPILSAWGFDLSVTKPSQPVRVAGIPRMKSYFGDIWKTSNVVGWQRLLFIDLNP